MRTFGTAIKAIQLSPNNETTMYDYTVPSRYSVKNGVGPAAQVTQMWFTGDLEWKVM